MELTAQELQNKARQVQTKVAPQLEEARKTLGELNEQALTFVRARPVTALLSVLACGYLIGKLARKL